MEADRWKAEDMDILNLFFSEINDLIERLDLGPDQLYNCDEKGFQMGATKGEVIVCHRDRPGLTSMKSSNLEWVTILECICAAGTAIEPLVIFKDKYVQKQWFPKQPPCWYYHVSPKG